MKKMHFLLSAAIAIFSVTANAQTSQAIKKDTVRVSGICEICKAKIEKAAKAAGASTAKWDPDTQILAVSYKTSGSSLEKIEKSVAGAGYDTQHEKATVDAFGKLQKCCQYPRSSTDPVEPAMKTD